jgi:hypothetical protein
MEQTAGPLPTDDVSHVVYLGEEAAPLFPLIIGSGTGLQVLFEDCAMDELLKLVDVNRPLPCDIDTGGCGRQNYVHHLLRAAPHVFTAGNNYQVAKFGALR